MEKKKISWITPDSFLDTDLPVVKALSDVYEITWIIGAPDFSVDEP